ncbi:hypothetical protein E2C01_089234 [Portunus trituberculatus]|uniref:Uncharacterized protein n=1 Tax=Portunus trituberculatus TaxID=210409 RepID=A0A5B7JCZ4_PORTR|nr:hypothetical protein [Portunus trituberculatus]
MLASLFPFQQVALDLFHLEGNTYIVYINRLMGWLKVDHLPGGATTSRLLTFFWHVCLTFKIPKDLFYNGGTNLTSHKARKFFSDWCIRLCISFVHYVLSNGRAEVGVKSGKGLL